MTYNIQLDNDIHLVDEIFRDFKEFGYIEDLKKMACLEEKYDKTK